MKKIKKRVSEIVFCVNINDELKGKKDSNELTVFLCREVVYKRYFIVPFKCNFSEIGAIFIRDLEFF